MSKAKSITQLVDALNKENERLKSLEKLFNRACKEEFGYDIRTLHKRLEMATLYENRNSSKQQEKRPVPQMPSTSSNEDE